MTLRHFIDTQDYAREELLTIVDLARQLKEAELTRTSFQKPLPGFLDLEVLTRQWPAAHAEAA